MVAPTIKRSLQTTVDEAKTFAKRQLNEIKDAFSTFDKQAGKELASFDKAGLQKAGRKSKGRYGGKNKEHDVATAADSIRRPRERSKNLP